MLYRFVLEPLLLSTFMKFLDFLLATEINQLGFRPNILDLPVNYVILGGSTLLLPRMGSLNLPELLRFPLNWNGCYC